MRTLVPLLVALALSVTSGAPARSAHPAKSRTVETLGPVRVGEKLPTFAGWDSEGDRISLREVLDPPRGRGEKPEALVVSFFATWCGPCRKGLPVIQKVNDERASDGVQTILVAFGEDEKKVRPFLKEMGLSLPTVLDTYVKIAERLGVTEALPRTFVVDRSGVTRTIFDIEGNDFEDRLNEAVDRALRAR